MNENIIDENGRELVRHGETDFPCAIYETRATGYPWHWHDEMELILVTKGALIIAAGKERFFTRENEMVLINADVPHALLTDNGMWYEERDIVFHPRLIAENGKNVMWSKYVLPFIRNAGVQGVLFRRESPACLEEIRRAGELFQCLDQKPIFFEFTVREILTRIFMKAWSMCPEMASESNGLCRLDHRVKLALGHIEQHYGEKISLQDLADVMHVSSRECQREFKRYLGLSPYQYVRQTRLAHAEELLSGTEESIAEISYRCGFKDCSSFSRQFRELYGMAPAKYRLSVGNPLAETDALKPRITMV